MDHKIILHHYWRSSCSWRLRWAMDYKDIPYKLTTVNLLKGEQDSPEYVSINPTASVPCLQVDNKYYSDSMACLEWLEATHPTPNLIPTNQRDAMVVRGLANSIASGVQPLQNLRVKRFFSDSKKEQNTYSKYWISRGFEAYEQLLALHNCSGKFSFGDELTITDLALIPQVYNALRIEFSMEQFPTVFDIYKRALQTKSGKSSHPDSHQPKA